MGACMSRRGCCRFLGWSGFEHGDVRHFRRTPFCLANAELKNSISLSLFYGEYCLARKGDSEPGVKTI